MTESRTAFLILHGWQNERPPEHWQHRIARVLREQGSAVEYPQLPSPSDPTVAEWSASVLDALRRLHDTGHVDDVVVIAHSLSVLLWLGARPDSPVEVSRVLLVAPPSVDVASAHEEIAEFAGLTFRLSPLDIGRATLVGSDDDPFNPSGAEVTFGEPLGIHTIMLPGQGHFTVDSGYGEWPSVLEWCVDAGAGIRSRSTGAGAGAGAGATSSARRGLEARG